MYTFHKIQISLSYVLCAMLRGYYVHFTQLLNNLNTAENEREYLILCPYINHGNDISVRNNIIPIYY